ncbi:right-handed parallel beta-helix repeat-containing protein [Candidatus Micrarchaeota archaeon]|nr:right-handed parallel beta-helix repeat-containing protein [Candidatus Micrarchaeota archaeon]
MCKNYAFTAAILLFLAFSASFAIDVSSCNTTINASGEYVLTSNLSGAGISVTGIDQVAEACILIQASDVSIDCNGYNISNNGTSDAAGIAANGTASSTYTNITIKNCPSIDGYFSQVILNHTANGSIQNVSAHNSAAVGVYLIYTSGTNLTNSTFYDVDYGAYIYKSNSTFVANTTAYAIGTMGILLENSSYCTVAENMVHNCSTYGGIAMYYDSDYNMIINNSVWNSTVGVELNRVSHNNFTRNLLWDNAYAGVYANNVSWERFESNTIYNNTDCGMNLSAFSNNTLLNNTVRNHTNTYGIYLHTYSGWNNLTNNTVYGNEDSIYFTGSTYNVLRGNFVYDNEEGIYFIGSAHNLVWGNFAYDNNDVGIYLDTGCNYTNITNNTVYGNYDGFFLEGGVGNRVWENQARDNSEGLYVHSTGYSYFYDNDLHLNVDGGVIFVSHSDNNTLANNTVRNCQDYTSVSIADSDNNTITGNMVYGSLDYEGFYFDTVMETLVADNVVYDCGDDGISMYYGVETTIANNTIYNGSNEGIYLYRCTNVTVEGNTIHYSPDYPGISMYRCPNVTLSSNILYANLQAVYLRDSNYTMVENELRGPTGAQADYTVLSAEDILNVTEQYSINWSDSPSTFPSGKASFAGKFINITTVAGSPSIDTISWSWLQAELSGYDEDTFELWRYNGSNWTLLNETPDTSSNLFTQGDLVPSSIYGILQTPSNESGGTDVEDYECLSSSECPDCYICSGHECVLPSGSCATASDCSGGYPFYTCEECSCVGHQCNVDSDCGAGYSCENGACVPPECTQDSDCDAGYSCENYECTPPECLEDSDCTAGATCSNYECTPPECTVDSNCKSGEMCENYVCVPWKCKANADCQNGFYCDKGACKKESIPGGPGSSSGGTPSGTPGGTGEAEVPQPEEEGPGTEQVEYAFPFLEGEAGSGIMPAIQVSEELKVSGWWIFLFLLILVGAFYFLQTRNKGRREE